jgi:hypothetical protein
MAADDVVGAGSGGAAVVVAVLCSNDGSDDGAVDVWAGAATSVDVVEEVVFDDGITSPLVSSEVIGVVDGDDVTWAAAGAGAAVDGDDDLAGALAAIVAEIVACSS